MDAMTRSGAQALAPEQVARPNYHANRHTQTGQFIRKGATPIKRTRAKRTTVSIKEGK